MNLETKPLEVNCKILKSGKYKIKNLLMFKFKLKQ